MAEYIDRDAAMLTPILPKEYRQYQTENLDDAYEEGWLDALSNLKNAPAADVEPGNWISVEDKLPEENDRVLVYVPDMKGSDCEIQISKGWALHKFVSHWMPLPEPPKGARMDGDGV